MEITYLSRADIVGLHMSMAEVMHAVEEGFRLKGLGKTEMPPKPGIHPRKDSFIHAMPAYVQEMEVCGMKWVSGFPLNGTKGLPYISGLIVLNDTETGLPIAVMDCAWITAMRTGASAGIAAKYLAAADSSVVGLLACGVQARASLAALVEALPRLATVLCYDILPEAADSFTRDMTVAFPRLAFTRCADPAGVTRGADVVVTAIPIVEHPSPPLDAGLLKDGGLAISLDYDSAWTSAAMKECDRFIPDDTNQLLRTRDSGIHFLGIPEKIDADLGEVVAGTRAGRQNPKEKIFSMNMGIAIDDMVTARVLLEKAVQAGVGKTLPL